MKTYKKILLLLLGVLIIVGTAYAWKAGGGVKWIGEVEQSDRFDDYSSDTTYGTGYYLDTYIGLKWQASENLPYGLKWTIDDSYTEPTWNETTKSYDYPSGRSSSDYPAFEYCESIGNGGWRLPTKNELSSIMTDIASGKNSNGAYTRLVNIIDDGYRASTLFDDDISTAHCGYFSDGAANGVEKTYDDDDEFPYKLYTICVHD